MKGKKDKRILYIFISTMAKEYQEQVIREHYHALTKFLIEKKMTITTMESATSGQIASLITDTEGASAILPGAFVYSCSVRPCQQKEGLSTFSVPCRGIRSQQLSSQGWG